MNARSPWPYGIDWLGYPKKPRLAEKPEPAAYTNFPEDREGYMAEMLAQMRQMQMNTRRTARDVRWLCIWIAAFTAISAIFWMDYVETSPDTRGFKVERIE